MNKYERIIYWSDDNNKYIVEVPELSGCMADGDTIEDANQHCDRVILEWIETAKAIGREVPNHKGKLVFA